MIDKKLLYQFINNKNSFLVAKELTLELHNRKRSIKSFVYVAVNFLFQLIFGSPLFLNSLAYITILRNNGKIKINWNKN